MNRLICVDIQRKNVQRQGRGEVWHWPETQRKQNLFAPYVNKFLKAKQESSGWPSGCETDEEQETYIAEYEKHEGILLDKEKIVVTQDVKQ